MTEPDTIASIVGIAGAGFRLSLILNAVSCEASNVRVEIHNIAKCVTLFSQRLKQSGTVLQQPDSVHSNEAIQAVKQIADKGNQVFGEITSMIEKVRSQGETEEHVQPLQQRFKFAFRKTRIKYLMAQLDSLKLSLLLMQQIFQLGKLMASTSRNDTPEEVKVMGGTIQQERMETQNTIVVRYFQISEVDRLYGECKDDESEPQSPIEYRNDKEETLSVVTSASSQLTIEPSPDFDPPGALVKLPLHSLGDVDDTLDQIKKSPKDMVRVSDQVIDPLLDRWTRWHEVREKRHQRNSGGRYAPVVQTAVEEDDQRQYYETYHGREDSPGKKYLEGSTTDWRRPNSAAARHEAAKLRKAFAGYQANISAASSDLEESPGSTASKKRSSRRHIVNSSPETSDSEDYKNQTHRRNSGASIAEKKYRPPETSYPARSVSGGQQQYTGPFPTSGGSGLPSNAAPRQMMPSNFGPPMNRPLPTPEQQTYHHSFSSPPPPINTHNAPYSLPYPSGHTPYSPHQGHLHPSHQPPRFVPPGPPGRSPPDPRPKSREGKSPRSPSRLSRNTNTGSGKHSRADEDWRPSRKEATKNLREGATKGLLAGGAIGAFLEALGSLDV